jgi:hypothetical protein
VHINAQCVHYDISIYMHTTCAHPNHSPPHLRCCCFFFFLMLTYEREHRVLVYLMSGLFHLVDPFKIHINLKSTLSHFEGGSSVGLSIIIVLCNHHCSLFWEHLHYPKRNLGPIKWSLSISSLQPLLISNLIFFLLWICLFWTFHINEIMQCIAFCI